MLLRSLFESCVEPRWGAPAFCGRPISLLGAVLTLAGNDYEGSISMGPLRDGKSKHFGSVTIVQRQFLRWARKHGPRRK